jgi:hypothetical protein
MQALVEETEQILQSWKHPEPYIPPTAPGGTKYERNLPPPILSRPSCHLPQLSILTVYSATTNGCMISRSSRLQTAQKQLEYKCSVHVQCSKQNVVTEGRVVVRISLHHPLDWDVMYSKP